jgi:hypothetical protein
MDQKVRGAVATATPDRGSYIVDTLPRTVQPHGMSGPEVKRLAGAVRFTDQAATATAFRFLRQPSRPIAPRPVAKSGRVAGSGVTYAPLGKSTYKDAQRRRQRPFGAGIPWRGGSGEFAKPSSLQDKQSQPG